MKYLLLLLCFKAVFLQDECKAGSKIHQCSKDKLQDDKCMVYDDEVKTYFLRNCPIDQTCADIKIEKNSDKFGYCINRLRKKFGGEKCAVNAECFSGKCEIEKGYCQNLADCKEHEQCSSTSYCKDKKCIHLLNSGDFCKDDDECPAGYVCGKKAEAEVNRCEKMFTVAVGQYANKRLLCESGFVHPSRDTVYSPFKDVVGLCSTSKLIVSNEECTQNDNCRYEISTGSSTLVTATGKCICSANGKTNYCTIGTDNEVWQYYLKEYKNAVDGITVNENQNTNYLRNNAWGKPRLMQAIKNVENYPVFKNADECTIRYISSSGFVKSSLPIMIALIALLI